MIIEIPGSDGYGGPWHITHPLLKLSLKYGLFGPWSGEPNWTIDFDRYALSRGPATGPPRMADLAITTLMNSGVRKGGMRGLSEWLGTRGPRLAAERLARTLASSHGLADAKPEAVDALSDFAEAAMKVHRIGPATVFKWLAAWAPAHVPMLDSLVLDALVGRERRSTRTPRAALPRFQRLLVEHLAGLSSLGVEIGARLDGALPAALPPVRVLDSLIWFDWWVSSRYYDKRFKKWLKPAEKANALEHGVTARGLDLRDVPRMTA